MFDRAGKRGKFTSFGIGIVQPARRGAEKELAARADHRERAVKGHAARVAKLAANTQPKGQVLTAGGASLDSAALEVFLAAVNGGIGALVEA